LQAQSEAYRKAFFHVNAAEVSDPFFSHLPRWELTAKLKMFLSEAVKFELENAETYREMRRMLPSAYEQWDGFSQAQYLEAVGLLPGYILSSQGDRMAMAHSVEGRFPFLDYRVVEFSTTIPVRFKMKVLNEKYLLKRAVGTLIPSSVQKRPKQPYRAPDAKSFFHQESQAARHAYINELLSPEQIRKNGLFNPAAVQKLVDKAKKGQIIGAKDNMALVGILSTQLLMEQFINNMRRHVVHANH
jgi:asparagine synthase (glutamine-hydrolysing)